ncbi:MAG: hypothetical protein ABI806_08735 [Candidatus Solibacter sp.]
MWRFTFNQELYRCANDVLISALDRGALKALVASDADTSAARATERPIQRGLRWETVASSHFSVLRTKVPGGWLISADASLTFYPDPAHLWDGT